MTSYDLAAGCVRALRSHTPLGVLQEVYGRLLAHYAGRAVMQPAALRRRRAGPIELYQDVRILRSALLKAQIVAHAQFAQ